MESAAVRSKTVIWLLLFHCFLLLPLCQGLCDWSLFVVCKYIAYSFSSLCYHLTEEEGVGFFISIIFCCLVNVSVLCLFLVVPLVEL